MTESVDSICRDSMGTQYMIIPKNLKISKVANLRISFYNNVLFSSKCFHDHHNSLVPNYDSFSTVFSNAKQQQFTLSCAQPHFFFKVAQGTWNQSLKASFVMRCDDLHLYACLQSTYQQKLIITQDHWISSNLKPCCHRTFAVQMFQMWQCIIWLSSQSILWVDNQSPSHISGWRSQYSTLHITYRSSHSNWSSH